jgi:cytochrome c553
MKRFVALVATTYFVALVLTVTAQPAAKTAASDGRETFRFDTFGDEQLWTDTLRMHEALATVTPAMALAVGLKVDSDALPPPVIRALQAGQVDLNDPKVTRRLLEMDAIVGIRAKIAGDQIKAVGTTCALCHSTVDNALAPGIGRRLDGWPNLDLNVGAILGLSPALGAGLKAEFAQWGPGKYDPRHHAFDGTQVVGLNSPSIPVVIPPAYGLQGVGFETFTGDGPISYWNAYVGIGQMGGQGNFSDPRIDLIISQRPDRVTPKLPELLAYQLSLLAPPPPAGSFDAAAATRGQDLFNGIARCGACHVPPTYTDVMRGPNPNVALLHAATEIGANPQYAARSATAAVSGTPMYRTTPLRALWQHPPYFHDGSAATLLAVVNHYDAVLALGLTAAQKADLIEFLKSL